VLGKPDPSLLRCCCPAFIFVAGQRPHNNADLMFPYVPTTDEAVTAMLTLADIKPLTCLRSGCGDGRIVAAEEVRHARRRGRY
jgi:hypothetical protein